MATTQHGPAGVLFVPDPVPENILHITVMRAIDKAANVDKHYTYIVDGPLRIHTWGRGDWLGRFNPNATKVTVHTGGSIQALDAVVREANARMKSGYSITEWAAMPGGWNLDDPDGRLDMSGRESVSAAWRWWNALGHGARTDILVGPSRGGKTIVGYVTGSYAHSVYGIPSCRPFQQRHSPLWQPLPADPTDISSFGED